MPPLAMPFSCDEPDDLFKLQQTMDGEKFRLMMMSEVYQAAWQSEQRKLAMHNNCALPLIRLAKYHSTLFYSTNQP